MDAQLTRGPILRGLLRFSLPLMAANILQQLYNLADTWIVGKYCGEAALGAVGSAFSVMVLLTSILTGLCMGAGVVVSQLYGQGDLPGVRQAAGNAFSAIAALTLGLTALACLLPDALVVLLRVPEAARADLRTYLAIVFLGLPFIFVYNYVASMLRAVGRSAVTLLFLLISVLSNVALDVLLVAVFELGAAGAAWATVIAQGLSALTCAAYFLFRAPDLRPGLADLKPRAALCRRILSVSALTSIQQSIMNFGILMVQSLVNSFGVPAMAAFAAGVKIDAFAYAPAQDFGNGFATFVAQNRGANQPERLRRGVGTALAMSAIFCGVISLLVCLFAQPLLGLFLEPPADPALPWEAMEIGVRYLRMEGACYIGIGVLFLLYATYRGMEQAHMSIVLTVISLGLRVLLSYTLAPLTGLTAIWLSIPIGWAVADLVGLLCLRKRL